MVLTSLQAVVFKGLMMVLQFVLTVIAHFHENIQNCCFSFSHIIVMLISFYTMAHTKHFKFVPWIIGICNLKDWVNNEKRSKTVNVPCIWLKKFGI